MAFNSKNESNSNSNSGNYERAQGFLNGYITLSDGTTEKIDAMKLFESKETQAKILKFFSENPEKVNEFMAKKVTWTFNSAIPKKRADIDFDL